MQNKSEDWRHSMDFAIEVTVGAQVYGRLTPKGVKDAIEKGEPVVVDVTKPDPEHPLFSLHISTDQKTLQPSYVTLYSPGAGQPVSMSCVEFELMWRMYERGRNKLVAAVGVKKNKVIGLPPVRYEKVVAPGAGAGASLENDKISDSDPGPYQALEQVP